MYNDVHRIQDALIPAMLEGVCYIMITNHPEHKNAYKGLQDTCLEYISECFAGLERQKRLKLHKRLNRIVKKIGQYAVKQNISCRKMMLITVGWADALLKAEGIYIPPDSKMFKELEELNNEIITAYDELDGIKKADKSALKHVPKIHKLAQAEGYF